MRDDGERNMFKIFIFTFCLICYLSDFVFAGLPFVPPTEYQNNAQNIYFVTTSGTGNCTSWEDACTFRDAVDKTSSTEHDLILLAPGSHDTDNGLDATGTIISTDYVEIIGVSGNRNNTVFVNNDAAPTNVMTVTGDNVFFKNVAFEENEVVQLTVSGDDSIIDNCEFRQSAGASGTGLLINGSSVRCMVYRTRFCGIIGTALHTNGTSNLIVEDVKICNSGVGIYSQNVNDQKFRFTNVGIYSCTTGIHVAGASSTCLNFDNIQFCNNTTNVDNDGPWDNTHFFLVKGDHFTEHTYPTGAATQVSTGDGAWTWTGAATSIIPTDTILTSFWIVGINVQDHNAAQVYKIELLYGDTVANTSIGIYEVRLGDTGDKKAVDVKVTMDALIPANSIIGAKAMSSTDGVDTIDITISYIPLD